MIFPENRLPFSGSCLVRLRNGGAIGASFQQAIFELAAGVKLARQNPADDEQKHDDAERDHRTAPVRGGTVSHKNSFVVSFAPAGLRFMPRARELKGWGYWGV